MLLYIGESIANKKFEIVKYNSDISFNSFGFNKTFG